MNLSPPVLRLPKAGRIVDQLRARRSRPAIDEATLAAVIAALGLTTRNQSRTLSPGWRNAMVSVDTDLGQMVIKRYPKRWPRDTIIHEHSIVNELERQAFPAVRLHRHDGTTWCEIAGHLYAATHYIEGSNLASVWMADTTRSKLITQSGQLLAQFHDALKDFEPAGNHHSSELEASNLHLDGLPRTELLGSIDETADMLRLLDIELSNSTAVGVVHADFGLHNILLRRGEPSVLHDFELSRVDHLLVDIAIAVARLPERMVPKFLAGYRERSHLASHDWNDFELVWQRHWYSAALRSYAMYNGHGDARRVDRARARLELAETNPATLGYRR